MIKENMYVRYSARKNLLRQKLALDLQQSSLILLNIN